VKLKDKKYFFFDLDDTLINTNAATQLGIEKAYSLLAKRCREDISTKLPLDKFKKELNSIYRRLGVREYDNEVFEEFCEGVTEKYKINPGTTGDSLAARLVMAYRETKNRVIMPQLNGLDLINHLKCAGRLVICFSNGRCNYQHTKLILAELDDEFEHLEVSEEETKENMLRKYIEQMQIDVNQCVIVGDSPKDIEDGQIIRMGTIRIRCGRHSADQCDKQPDLEFKSVPEFFEFIKKELPLEVESKRKNCGGSLYSVQTP
jgi:FMN phosphatase YigB (HAD superfamily)